ncbi:equilibrative nucleobase transporter 1-like [Amphiura filiformis]|uniref:equilibrative nucleobase transporter 1-like n=1 Tax=Amphiura filiformis TaxID=82378 RepID=UPI003B210615
METAKKYVLTVLGFCEMLFFSGIIYGWAALVYVLKEEGFYSHLCQNQTMQPADEDIATISCVKQDAILNLIFTISSFALQGSLFLFGVLFDNLGTRFTRLLLHILLVAGFLTMLLSSPSLPQLLFPGMILLALGGGQFIPANIQIGNLFKNHHTTVISILSGAFDSSAAVFVFVKLGYDGGISLQTSFAIMIGITSLFFINTFLLMPVDHIRLYDLPIKGHGNQDGEINNPDDETIIRDNQEDSRREAETLKNETFPTLKSCVTSPSFLLLILWYSILQLRTVYYVGTLNPYLIRLTNEDDKQVSHYTEVFSYLQLGSVFVAPFCGLLLDRNKFRKGVSRIVRGPYADLQDSVTGFVGTTTLFVLFSLINLIPILEMQYLTFVLQVITRTYLYALAMAILPIMFPSRYFGSLYGLLSTTGSVVLLLQFPLFLLTQHVFDDDPLVINAILLFACLLTLTLPIYLFVWTKRKNNEIASREENIGLDNEGIDLSETWMPPKNLPTLRLLSYKFPVHCGLCSFLSGQCPFDTVSKFSLQSRTREVVESNSSTFIIMARPLRYYFTFFLGYFEMMFFGGLIFGWASLVYILKSEGYFNHLCFNNDTITNSENITESTVCDGRDAYLNLVFTVGVFTNQGCMFFCGFLFDTFGTRYTRLFLHFLLVSGFLMIILSSPASPYLLFPAMMCISTGGIQLMPTNLQIGNLFDNRRSTVMTALTGAFDGSSFVMLLFMMTYKQGVSIDVSFSIMLGASLLFFINTFGLLPVDRIPWPLPQNYDKGYDNEGFEIEDNKGVAPKPTGEEIVVKASEQAAARLLAEHYRNKDYPNLKSCIFSPAFGLLAFWLSTLQLKAVYCVGTLSPYLVQSEDQMLEIK